MNIIDIVFGVIAILASVLALYYKTKLGSPTKGYSEEELEIAVAEREKQIKEQKQAQLNEFKTELQARFSEREQNIGEDLERRNAIVLDEARINIRKDIEKELENIREKTLTLQDVVSQKQEEVSKKYEEVIEAKQKNEEDRLALIEDQKLLSVEKDTFHATVNDKLAAIARLTPDQARAELFVQVKNDIAEDLLDYQRKSLDFAKESADEKAREIVSMAIQRCSSEVANEMTVVSVKLTSPEDKGKVIGKGGRNIQWFEKTLGVEIIVDEVPDLVTISGFSSIRRHIAKRTLELLLADGRVHPSSIEEKAEKAKAEISTEISRAGKEAVESLGIYDFPDALVRIIGRLKFRTSYGQNILKHSVEMARLAGLLAKEMNEEFGHARPVDVMMCIKGALLHDIGKAIDEETQPKGDHVSLGAKVCDKFGLDWRIRKCVTAHHDESYVDEKNGVSLEAILVDACDNISGGRPGARKETMEAFSQRVEALEKIADEIPGVSKSWVMRGARELWVFFDTSNVSASRMYDLTHEITGRIEAEVRYPGEIKVIGLWEDRVIEYAK
jgi:ribonucrease Y